MRRDEAIQKLIKARDRAIRLPPALDRLKTKKSTFGTLKLILKQGRARGKLKATSDHLPAKPPMSPVIGLPPAVINTAGEAGLRAIEHDELSLALIDVDRPGAPAGSLTRKLFDLRLF